MIPIVVGSILPLTLLFGTVVTSTSFSFLVELSGFRPII